MKVKILKKLPKSKRKTPAPTKKVTLAKANTEREKYLRFYDDIKIEGNGKNDW